LGLGQTMAEWLHPKNPPICAQSKLLTSDAYSVQCGAS
jgi:hypothetical protein